MSPHLSIWRWGPHMLVSILHRACGVAMAVAGVLIFVWWLAALAGGPDSYGDFHYWVVDAAGAGGLAGVVNLLSRLAAIGLTWTLFQHLANGVRHLVMDMGAGYELRTNRAGAIATMVFSVGATLATWVVILMKASA